MADLAEIAAAAGIAIIDNSSGDAEEIHLDTNNDVRHVSIPHDGSGDSKVTNKILELETMFIDRYTENDPDYVSNSESAEAASHPPCVVGYSCRRQRDDSRGWNRNSRGYNQRHHDGGDGEGYRNRGGYHQDWNRRGGGGWHRGDNRSYDRPRDYGDYHQRGYRDYRQGDHGDRRDRSPHR